MNKIFVGIFDEHKLVQEGISAILKANQDIEIKLTADSKSQLMKGLNTNIVHVLLLNVHVINTSMLNLLMQLNISFPKVKMLIISVHNDEEIILKTIKAGAKGFLSKDSGKTELAEAIYTLRNGYDYYSQSITHLLLKKYISRIQNEHSDGKSNFKNLSSREFEIIKLWGNSFTNKEIADMLFISLRTVESHKNHIMQKLNLKTAVDLVKFAIKNNIVEI
jgi:two-component system response regulator NreC